PVHRQFHQRQQLWRLCREEPARAEPPALLVDELTQWHTEGLTYAQPLDGVAIPAVEPQHARPEAAGRGVGQPEPGALAEGVDVQRLDTLAGEWIDRPAVEFAPRRAAGQQQPDSQDGNASTHRQW